MKIGILSDTHNCAASTQAALDAFRARGIARLIHCGDFTLPHIIELFAGWDVTLVLGNMDHEREDLAAAARRIGATPPALTREIEADGVWIGATHGHDRGLLWRMVSSGKYACVCHGHTHERRDEWRDDYGVRLVNPGALGGWAPQTRSVCILDTGTGSVEFVEFPELP